MFAIPVARRHQNINLSIHAETRYISLLQWSRDYFGTQITRTVIAILDHNTSITQYVNYITVVATLRLFYLSSNIF